MITSKQKKSDIVNVERSYHPGKDIVPNVPKREERKLSRNQLENTDSM